MSRRTGGGGRQAKWKLALVGAPTNRCPLLAYGVSRRRGGPGDRRLRATLKGLRRLRRLRAHALGRRGIVGTLDTPNVENQPGRGPALSKLGERPEPRPSPAAMKTTFLRLCPSFWGGGCCFPRRPYLTAPIRPLAQALRRCGASPTRRPSSCRLGASWALRGFLLRPEGANSTTCRHRPRLCPFRELRALDVNHQVSRRPDFRPWSGWAMASSPFRRPAYAGLGASSAFPECLVSTI